MEADGDVSEPSEPLLSNLQGFWTRETTLALLKAYEIQNDRLGKDFRFKKYMWQAMSNEVKKQTGADFSPAQCENRWRVLYRGYRRAVDNNLKSKRRSDFRYLEEMRKVMKDQGNTNPVLPLSDAGVFACDVKSNVQIEGVNEPKPSPSSSSKQFFLISGKPNVNGDRVCSEPEPAPSSISKQLFIISGQPNVNSDRICSEPKLVPSSCGKQLFLISGNSTVNSSVISSEPGPASNNSAKKFFIIGGKPNVNSDSVSSQPEPPPNSSSQLSNSPPKPLVSPPEKRKKKNQTVLEKMRDDRKLYYENKLKIDKVRVESSDSRKEELVQLEKMKLQQRERLIACEEERLKCEKEKLLVSQEKLRMYSKLVHLQEENNEILRSINDKFDFLL